MAFLILVRDRRVLEALDTDFRLATKLRTLSRLYLGVAHDLKAPLNAMGLNLALLQSSLQDERSGDEERRRHWAQVVEQELGRLQRELERLLAQTAPSREEVEEYDLRCVLEEVQALLAPQGKQQGVRILLEVPPAVVKIRGRQDLVKQALLNVALNALEASPESGTVRLELQVQDQRALIRIADEGEGIAEEHRDHIFEVHFTTKEEGTGIGLYIAQSILESEGGTLILRETGTLEDTGASGTVLESSLPIA